MTLSIIIPSYNMGGKIDQCLKSIYLQENIDETQFEVVVCDSSDDNSMGEYKKWCLLKQNLKVIHSHIKMPPGTARNLAVEKAVGDYIMCVDIDDRLARNDVLKKVMDGLDGKDIYACSYVSRKDKKEVVLKPQNARQMASIPVAPWLKICKRELWVKEPGYYPEDVWPHFLLVDKCSTFGYFDFAIVDYDNTPENKGAASRTFDWLFHNPTNLMCLIKDKTFEKEGLRDEFLAGVFHNMGDMWLHRNDFKNEDVKTEFLRRLSNEYKNLMSGIYVH